MNLSESDVRNDDYAERASNSDPRSLGRLIVELTRELNELFLTEVELTRTEVSQKIEQAAGGLATLLLGGLTAVGGLMALVAAAVIAVHDFVIHEWALSALIVGIAVMALGGFIAMVGKNRMEARKLMPERVARNVKEDVQFLKDGIARTV